MWKTTHLSRKTIVKMLTSKMSLCLIRVEYNNLITCTFSTFEYLDCSLSSTTIFYSFILFACKLTDTIPCIRTLAISVFYVRNNCLSRSIT